MKVKIKLLNKNAVVPVYAKPGDAGLDLVATHIISYDKEQVVYGTGLAIEIPEGYVGLVFPRSSIRKYEQYLSNSVGVIDSGYRGEIQATFNSRFYADVKYKAGEKIAQLIIMPYPQIEFEEVTELSETERADGGHGSTGK
jgi:dUTP pyrophosphatase